MHLLILTSGLNEAEFQKEDTSCIFICCANKLGGKLDGQILIRGLIGKISLFFIIHRLSSLSTFIDVGLIS